MATLNTSQQFADVKLSITNSKGQAAQVDGVPIWASSDETVVQVIASDDGMSAVINAIAAGVARVTVTADADLGTGVTSITGTTEDITVTLDPADSASAMTLDVGTASAKA